MFGLMGVARMSGQPGGGFSPLSLFAAGEQGLWFDPSDFSSMYQDSAGTTPVTAVGQPVGLILDKRLGLALGAESVTNGDFSDGSTGWTFESGWEVSGGAATKTSGGQNAIYQFYSFIGGRTYVVEFDVVAIDAGGVVFAGIGSAAASFTTVGRKKAYLRPAADASLAYFTGQVNATLTVLDNISIREIAGNHATQATAAARPILRQDGGGKYYLEFDGVDDFLETAAVNLTSTSQLSVFCGFASDTSVGIFAPLYGNGLANSAGTAGKFAAYIPANNSTTARFDFGGVTSQIFTSATAASNVVSVLSHLLDSTTAPQQIIRQDGTQTATGTFDVGSQPFANAAIKIADISHMGGGAYYKGKLYGIVVRGALSSAGEIDNAEAYIAGKSGVVL